MKKFIFKVPPTDGTSLSDNNLRATNKSFAADKTGEALDVKNQADHPHHEFGTINFLQASSALCTEDPLVVGATVKFVLANKTRVRERRGTRGTRQTVLVVISLGHSHHITIKYHSTTIRTNRLKKTCFRFYRH